MTGLVEKLRAAFAKYRMTFGSELDLQNQLAEIFKLEGVEFAREFILSKADRPDFFILPEGYAIEVKVSGSIEAHLRQMKRYNNHPTVLGTILIATKPFAVPDALSGKPIAIINIGGNRL